MRNLEIRPATAKLLKRFYGYAPRTQRSLVFMSGDEPVGVVGIYFEKTYAVLFSDISDLMRSQLRKHTRRVIECLRRLLSTDIYLPLLAWANPAIDRSRETLEHFGFRPIGGDYYQWAT